MASDPSDRPSGPPATPPENGQSASAKQTSENAAKDAAAPAQPIQVSVSSTRERKRRQRELWAALGSLVLLGGLTWVQLTYLGVESHLFLVLINLNVILVGIILFVVARNMVKLMLERRRRVLGSRLRTRLVLSFMSLSLIPLVLMFLIAVRFVQTGMDYWFRASMATSMDKALEAGQEIYALAGERLERMGLSLVEDIRDADMTWGGTEMDAMLQRRARQWGLGLVGVVTPDKERRNWQAKGPFIGIWPEIEDRVSWREMHEDPSYRARVIPTPRTDLVIGVLPVDGGRSGYLLLGEDLGRSLLSTLDEIVRGVDEYKKLSNLKYPLKLSLYLTLSVITLSLILGSMWFGFRLAKELSAPVLALAAGTRRIAQGDLSVRLEDQSPDELGFLVQSFNRMAADLESGQESLTAANERLGMQNQELEARGSYMEAVLNNITAGVVSLDSEGKLSTINRAAEAMLGLDARRLMGSDPLTLVPPGEHREFLSRMLAELEAHPEATWQRQIELTIGSRQVTLLVNVVALRTADGTSVGVVALFEDITELEKMQRLAAWREVARRIAHEIKNPLTPIKLSAQRLEKKFGPRVADPAFGECTGLIIRQVEHMQQMVTEFSAFAKLPEITPTPGELVPLVQETVALFRHSHAQIRFELIVPGLIPTMRFDREAIKRVLMNLLTNACEALEGQGDGHAGGKIEVELQHDPVLRLVRLEVRDNGPGMSVEERSRLFEPYFSRKKGGTGLGLTIARSIVADHFGYIRVRPGKTGGTTFVVELPVTPKSGQSGATPGSDSSPAPTSAPTSV